MQKKELINDLIVFLNSTFNLNSYYYNKSKQTFEKNNKYIIDLNFGIDIINVSFGIDFTNYNIELSQIYNRIKYMKPLQTDIQISLENKSTWQTIVNQFNSIILPEMDKLQNIDYLIEKLLQKDPKQWEISLSERIRILPLLYLLKNDFANTLLVLEKMREYINEDQFIPKYNIFCDLVMNYINKKSG